MALQLANSKERSIQKLLAKDKVRLRNPQTGELLHLSGQGTTTDVTWSWLGHHRQAETLRKRAMSRGEEWPFAPVHRSILDPTRQHHDEARNLSEANQ